jgi:hypothetical protein
VVGYGLMIETLWGSITSVGFRSGDRFVVGHWDLSPIGPFSDVMWARPDGERLLLASDIAAEFIASVYPFDFVYVTDVEVTLGRRRIEIDAGPVQLRLDLGRLVLPFPPRPRWVTASIENLVSRSVMGVRTVGTSPTGAREWYRTRRVRTVRSGETFIHGRSCGELGPMTRPIGFGFTDPPQWPSHVKLRVDLNRSIQ